MLSSVLICAAASAAAGTIAGTAFDMHGQKAHEVFVHAVGHGANAGSQRGGGFVYSGGYEIADLSPGVYVVYLHDYFAYRPLIVNAVNVPLSGVVPLDFHYRNAVSTALIPHVNTTVGSCAEVAQTFVATGTQLHKIMLVAAGPLSELRVAVHEDGPTGPQLGLPKTLTIGGSFPGFVTWRLGEMATKPGKTYCVRVFRNGPPSWYPHVASSHEFYPNGHLWIDGVAYPDRDMPTEISFQDDGLVYEMEHDGNWRNDQFTSVGQTFRAHGKELRYTSILLAGSGTSHLMRARLFRSPGGAQIGPAKINRMDADVPGVALWAPGEAPLEPGETYYLEWTRADGGSFAVYGDRGGYQLGQAYFNGVADSIDLRCVIISSEVDLPAIALTQIQITGLTPQTATVTWKSNPAASGYVEYWREPAPPHKSVGGYREAETADHLAQLTELTPGAMYKFQVVTWKPGHALTRGPIMELTTPAAAGQLRGTITAAGGQPIADAHVLARPGEYRARSDAQGRYALPLPAGTFDVTFAAACAREQTHAGVTITAGGATTRDVALYPEPNLLRNGGFEEALNHWTRYGRFDGAFPSGARNVPARTGTRWAGSDGAWDPKVGGVYQQVAVSAGVPLTVTAHVWTNARVDGRNRAGFAQGRMGVDPAGGNNPLAPTVQWTPWAYTYGQWRALQLHVTPTSTTITVFLESNYESFWPLPEQYTVGWDDVCVTYPVGATLDVR